MDPQTLEGFVDADEAGELLSLNRRRILELARARKLPGHPIGDGARRVSGDSGWANSLPPCLRRKNLGLLLGKKPVWFSPRQSPALSGRKAEKRCGYTTGIRPAPVTSGELKTRS